MLLAGDWVIPVSSPPLAGGGVLIKGGEIAEVGPAAQLRARHPGEQVREFLGCALLPGFVDAHTHLDYSAFRGFKASHGFLRWIVRLTRARRKLEVGDLAASALWGAHECLRNGITTIADASYGGSTVARAAETVGLRARVYLEVFGLDDRRLGATMKRLEAALEQARSEAAPGAPVPVEWGISPHAPYTVSQELYREVARLARRSGLRMTSHVAESKAEMRLLAWRPGRAAWVYKTVASLCTGERWRLPRKRPVEYVADADALGPDMLVVHAVQLDAEDIAILAQGGAPVVHCPRSNQRLRCGAAPVAELRAAGVTVGLGTDSLASNDGLDMLAEMRAALEVSRERAARAGAPAPLSAAEVLRMATLDGARTLGWERLVGSLEKGKSADVAVVELPSTVPVSVSADALAAAVMQGEVRLTVVDGRVAYEGATMPPEVVRGLAAVRSKLGLKG